jgi:hypothetical protein
MGARRARSFAIALIALAAYGCGTTQPARFYTLDSTAIADGAPAMRTAVMVGPATIPAAVDQPQFVLQVASNQVQIDEFHRWAAPLNDSIARAVAGNLAVLLGTPEVATATTANEFLCYRAVDGVSPIRSGNTSDHYKFRFDDGFSRVERMVTRSLATLNIRSTAHSSGILGDAPEPLFRSWRGTRTELEARLGQPRGTANPFSATEYWRRPS